MKMMLLVIAVLLTLLMIGSVVAYHYAGIWGLIGAIVAVLVLARFTPRILGWLFFRGLRQTMSAQAAALRGATVEVHSIEPAPTPPSDPDDYDSADDDSEHDEWDDVDVGEDEEDAASAGDHDSGTLMDPEMADLFYDGPRHWYYVDVTVYPEMRADGRPTEYTPWHPRLVMLLGPTKDWPAQTPLGAFPHIADGICEVRELSVWRHGSWEAEESEEVLGPQRLRMYVGVKPGVKELRFNYFFETIGVLNLPQN